MIYKNYTRFYTQQCKVGCFVLFKSWGNWGYEKNNACENEHILFASIYL